MTVKSRKYTLRSDVFHIGKIIEANVVPDGETDGVKFVKYKDGWDDERVTTVSGSSITTVRRLRQELFGQLRKAVGENFYKAMLSRVADLERRMQELEDQITKPSSIKTFSDLPKIINGPNRP